MSIVSAIIFFVLFFGVLLWFARVYLPNQPVTGPKGRNKKP